MRAKILQLGRFGRLSVSLFGLLEVDDIPDSGQIL